jgi:hypothetical protein
MCETGPAKSRGAPIQERDFCEMLISRQDLTRYISSVMLCVDKLLTV